MTSPAFSIPATHPALAGHFPGNPIVPGVVLLEHLLCELQQATVLRWPLTLGQVKFLAPVRADEPLHVAIDSLEETRARLRLLRGEETMLEATVKW